MRFADGWWRHRPRLLQVTLLLTGLGMLLVAAVFLLGGGWSRSSAPNAAAFQPATSAQPAIGISVPNTGANLRPLFARLFAFPTATATPPVLPVAATPTLQPAAQPPASAPLAAFTPLPPAPAPTDPPPPPAPTIPPPPAAPSCPTAGMSGYALDLFTAINNERANAGLGALAADGCVIYVAQLRSSDMATRGYFAHTSPDGISTFDLLDTYSVPHGWAGENLARNNYPDSESVGVAIRDLMASQGHRENILSTNYTALGVGYAVDGTGMKYFVMVFIGPPL